MIFIMFMHNKCHILELIGILYLFKYINKVKAIFVLFN